MNPSRPAALAAIYVVLLCQMEMPGHAQTCTEPAAADFRVNALVTTGLKNPVHLAVAPDGRVFIADLNSGEIRLYKPGSSATTVAGKAPSRYNNEDGLLGVALHPRFAQNGFLFAMYTTLNTNAPAHVLYRYKVNGADPPGYAGMDSGRRHVAEGLVPELARQGSRSFGPETSHYPALRIK